MSGYIYAFEPGGPKRLEIVYRARWKNSPVKLDGVQIGAIPGIKELREGVKLKTPEGKELEILLPGKYQKIVVTCDGQKLPESSENALPLSLLWMSAFGLYYLGIGLQNVFLKGEMLKIAGAVDILIGLFFWFAAYLVHKSKKGAFEALLVCDLMIVWSVFQVGKALYANGQFNCLIGGVMAGVLLGIAIDIPQVLRWKKERMQYAERHPQQAEK
jgi:hypothetical protein